VVIGNRNNTLGWSVQMKTNSDSTTEVVFQGISGAPGLAFGPVYLWRKNKLIVPKHSGQNPAVELDRLNLALQAASSQLQGLSDQLAIEGHTAEAAVFLAHIELVNDRGLQRRVQTALASGTNVESIWDETVEKYAKQLEAMPDPTFALRAADLRDVSERVLRILMNEPVQVKALTQPSVVIAQDLTPSETVGLNKEFVLAFCTASGGPTSHTAILAKALCLPAVVSLGEKLMEVAIGTPLLVDGSKGTVTVSPDETTLKDFLSRSSQATALSKIELASAKLPATTLDGITFEIVANIGGEKDARSALEFGAEGVGLFRTEFVFLDRSSSPSDEEQLEAYRAVLREMGQRPVVIRTLDAGGDKELTYLEMPPEANPFLGERAIRLCLSRPELFKQQLRALLRAGAGHNLRIMFPMIATMAELRNAKALFEEARIEVLSMGYTLPESVQVGIMVEIPSTAIMADRFATEVDFFSIGTNDLTQYSLAADRTNPKVAYLNDHCHPAILRLIAQTTKAAHNAGIWVGVCGEMAGDPDAIPLLVGLGIDELSMSPGLIPHAKSLIRELNMKQAVSLAQDAMEKDSAAEVRECVRQQRSEI
jgi:phosphoenolpyruvate-protein phosphotransferase